MFQCNLRNLWIALTLLPTAELGRWTRVRDVDEALLIRLGVEIDAVPDAAEQRTTHAVFGDTIAQVEHGVCFAPIFTIFPDRNRSATHLAG